MKRFAFIALHAACWPVRQQCRLLGVSPSGYYAWHKCVPVAAVEPALAVWQVVTQCVFATHTGRYGQRRLRAQLRREGHAVGRQLLMKLSHFQRLTRPLHPRQLPAPRTTQADPQAVSAANKLASWPAATAPNQVWVGDISYLATSHWTYLAAGATLFPGAWLAGT